VQCSLWVATRNGIHASHQIIHGNRLALLAPFAWFASFAVSPFCRSSTFGPLPGHFCFLLSAFCFSPHGPACHAR
jgi:hypothetical protein